MKVLITTFGGDGGKSGISQYIIQVLKALPEAFPEATFDVLHYSDEGGVYFQESERMHGCVQSDFWRSAMANIAWHMIGLPGFVRRGGYDVVFIPAHRTKIRRSPYGVQQTSGAQTHPLSRPGYHHQRVQQGRHSKLYGYRRRSH
jgi:hypothetical protein